jgi:hypothetical protein
MDPTLHPSTYSLCTGGPLTKNTDTYHICEYCGKVHKGWCERIHSIEYHENGNIKKVTLVVPQNAVQYPDIGKDPIIQQRHSE